MRDEQQKARIAALSILQAQACAKLLEAHGRTGQAANLSMAIDEVTEIVAGHVGTDTLSAAMDWVSCRLWGYPERERGASRARRPLH